MRRRLLLVGRNRYRLPLESGLRRKFDALEERFELRVLASAPAGAPTADRVFTLVPPFRPRLFDGALFYAALPLRVARELRRFRPDAVLAQSAYEGAAVLAGRALARTPTRVVVEVHGDWRASTRLHGSPVRRLAAPLADRVATAALRRADAVRTVTEYATRLVRAHGVEPADAFPAFMDLEPFVERPPAPLPERPQALFVGLLEPVKNVDVLAAAWRLAAPRVPDARLELVGTGSRQEAAERLVADLPAQTAWAPTLGSGQVAEALDRSTVLVLPSRSEGMGRVVVEALCRGRPVIGARTGGIRELVEDGVNGLLVEPGDAAALADALVRVLTDRGLAGRLAAAARPSVEPWLATPSEYAERLCGLVERTVHTVSACAERAPSSS